MADGPAAWIARIIALDDYIEAQEKKLSEYLRSTREELEATRSRLHEFLLSTEGKLFKSEHGTAYLSTITRPSVEDKIGYLDWVLESWDERGAMLNIGAPLKEGLQGYLDAHNGELPPFVKQTSIIRVNVRRS